MYIKTTYKRVWIDYIYGICLRWNMLIMGLCTRQTEKNEKDRDDIIHTLGRGFGFFIVISTGLSLLIGIIYLIVG